ncbi:MAG: hypothetical protein ABI581_15320 [Sediminibacterium sp.]
MKKNLLITISFLLLSFTVFAQASISGYTNFSPIFPMGEYKDVYDRTAWGGRLGVLVQPNKKLPVKLGVELGYATQGFHTQYYNSIGFSDFSDYRARARLNIFSGLFNLRLQSGTGKHAVDPFVEGMIGWNNFYGSTVLQGRNPAEDYSWDKIDRESTKGYWGLTYGGSGGFDIRLHKKEHYVSLELRISYLKGSKTKYYSNPSVDPNGYSSFTVNESTTDMLIPQIGFKFGL